MEIIIDFFKSNPLAYLSIFIATIYGLLAFLGFSDLGNIFLEMLPFGDDDSDTSSD